MGAGVRAGSSWLQLATEVCVRWLAVSACKVGMLSACEHHLEQLERHSFQEPPLVDWLELEDSQVALLDEPKVLLPTRVK